MPKAKLAARALSTAEVAKLAGVHRDTLLRWLREKLIPEPGRDRRGWRVFTQVEADTIATFARRETRTNAVFEAKQQYPSYPEVNRLRGIDWDFRDAKTSYLTHGLHPYPAKYIPQIPNALIQELSSVGETVADVFCGSGTTLVEALLLKRQAVGVDANPLACLISQAKTTLITEDDAHALLDLGQRSTALGKELSLRQMGSLFEGRSFTSDAPRPSTEAIGFWFEPFIVEELAEILAWCRSLSTATSRTLALAAFSSIVVAVSKQDSDTRYVRRDKGLSPGDAFKRFGRSLLDARTAAIEFADLVEERFRATVIAGDILQTPDIGLVDLVVCSPPYPNAYSYHLYHMTRMVWLGMDQPLFKTQEIGSHRKYSSKGPKRATEETFSAEMASMFQWLSRHVRNDGYACFVVGPSTVAGRTIDNAALLAEAARPSGFHEVARLSRRMHDGKKSFNPSIGKIKDESIVVLRHQRP